MNNFIRLSTARARLINWLARYGASQYDDREVLYQTIYHDDDALVSADGFKLIMVEKSALSQIEPTDEPLDGLEGEVVHWKDTRNHQGIAEWEILTDAKFPDYSQIVPNEEPTFEIALNPKLLLEILKYALKNEPLHMAFYGAHAPVNIYGHIGTGEPFMAVLMPMHLRDENEQPWMPAKVRQRLEKSK